MGKASSSKKVARAARTGGGRVSGGQPRSFLFPGVLTLVVVLGLALVIVARNDRLSQDMGGPPQFGDHFHVAFGVNACGEWLPDLPEFNSRVGIHTHGDGLIHVHPFSGLGVGANATLDRYLRDARTDGGFDADISTSSISWLGGEYRTGDPERCEGIDDPQIRVAYWDRGATEPRITSGDFGNIRLGTDGAAIAVYYGDPDDRPGVPPSTPALQAVSGLLTEDLPLDIPEDAEILDDPDALAEAGVGGEAEGGDDEATDDGTDGDDDEDAGESSGEADTTGP